MFHRSRYLQTTKAGRAEQWQRARMLVQIFALLTLYTTASFVMPRWAEWRVATGIVPLWPIQWMAWLPTPTAVDVICLYALGATAGAFFFVEHRGWRLNAALAVLFLHALINSFGKINHSWHPWVLVTCAFVFLPTGPWRTYPPEDERRDHFYAVIWGAQLLVMVIYTLSGLWKIYGIIAQWQEGTMTALHPNAFAYQVANRTLQTNTVGPLSRLVIQVPWLGWLPYLAVIYLETFAVVTVWRPRLQRLWAAGLIGFHIGSWLTMTITFNAQILVLGLLFWFSPFVPQENSLRQVLRELPIVKELLRLARDWGRLRGTTRSSRESRVTIQNTEGTEGTEGTENTENTEGTEEFMPSGADRRATDIYRHSDNV
ncbi:MAG: hypothetical protein KDE58_05695, partial [Caldilineaceae bacterium]|nr:hypothetical protein [Caldilineaceae bacterium]